MQTHVALIGCVDKGSSIVAETIDLGTADATGGFAFAAAGPAVSGPTSGPGRSALDRLSGNEVADDAFPGVDHFVFF